ncbi:MAG TPA: hypothetical protein VHC21_04315 [Candidatus Saccharimonadales bacterium]|nr:hypothetical protein [Candidatus Saccharimonadales bacterium]
MAIEKSGSEVYAYGNAAEFKVTKLWFPNGQLSSTVTEISRAQPIDPDRYQEALHDINESWSVAEDEPTGQQFELALANTDADFSAGVDLEVSTFSSSLSNNPGNAVEFAENSALHPDRPRLYLASPGNGKTSYWTPAEQRHIKVTGRFTDEGGRPLPTIAALARVLEQAELPVSRISTNSAGGAYATALMSVLPEGRLSHAYIKSRPNISDHPAGLAWGATVLLGDMLDDRRHSRVSADPWRLTQDTIKAAKKELPRLYSEDSARNEARRVPEATKTHGLKKMYTDLLALSRGQTYGNVGPAAQDTGLALRRQPEARLTYHVPTRDRLYRERADIDRFMEQVRQLGGVAARHSLEALIVPGSHRDHTAYPALRWSLETYAFSR